MVAFFWQIVVRVDNDDGDNDNDDGNGDNDNDNGDGTHRKSFLRRHLDHAAQQVLTIGRHEVGNVEHPALHLHEIEIERVNFFLSIINQVWTLIIRCDINKWKSVQNPSGLYSTAICTMIGWWLEEWLSPIEIQNWCTIC